MDASDYATEGVLLMECEDRFWRPVAFLSKSLNETERNYEIHDKEIVVATTHHSRTNDLTTSKALQWAIK